MKSFIRYIIADGVITTVCLLAAGGDFMRVLSGDRSTFTLVAGVIGLIGGLGAMLMLSLLSYHLAKQSATAE